MGRGASQVAYLVLLCLLCTIQIGHTLDNGVGRTPAMGWNSWNTFRCDINETLIKEIADAVAASGLRDAGYRYINIDDCWQERRAPDGSIQPFADKFPSGMKALADYVHSKGLLFGLYSDTGAKTCEGYPGSWGHETQYDYCAMEKVTEAADVTYARMRDALAATGRPILFSICNWGGSAPHLWGNKTGNSWRTGIDVFAVWDQEEARRLRLPSFLQSVLSAARQQEQLYPYAGPGGFNDPDMLVVGLEGMFPYGIVNDCPPHVKGCKPGQYISREEWGQVGGLTVTEQRSHFSLWCMLAAPLILGNDPRAMRRSTLDILLAPEVIALNQDPLGSQGRKVRVMSGGVEVWRKDLAGGDVALLVLNTGGRQLEAVVVTWADDLPDVELMWRRKLPAAAAVECRDKQKQCATWAAAGECSENPGYMLQNCQASCPGGCPKPQPSAPTATARVRDLWQREDLGARPAAMTVRHLEAHEGRLYRLTFFDPLKAPPSRPLPHPAFNSSYLQLQKAEGPGGEGGSRVAAELEATKLELEVATQQLFALREEQRRRPGQSVRAAGRERDRPSSQGALESAGSVKARGDVRLEGNVKLLSRTRTDRVIGGGGVGGQVAGHEREGAAVGAGVGRGYYRRRPGTLDLTGALDGVLAFGCCTTAVALFVMARGRRQRAKAARGVV